MKDERSKISGLGREDISVGGGRTMGGEEVGGGGGQQTRTGAGR